MLIIFSILVCTYTITYLVSHLYLSIWIFPDLKKFKNMIKDIFSIIFGISNVLLSMVFIEILKINNKSSRRFVWELIINSFTIIMYYILPLLIIVLIFKHNTKGRNLFKKYSYIIVYLLYLILSNFKLYYFQEKNYPYFSFYFNSLNLMEYLVLISIFLSSMLSGYSCTQHVLNNIIYPFYKEIIEGKLEDYMNRYKKIGIKIEKRKSIMIDKSKLREFNYEHPRVERRQSNLRIDFKFPDKRKSFIKPEFKPERRQSNLNLIKNAGLKQKLQNLQLMKLKLEVNINLLKDKSVQQYNKLITVINFFIGKFLAVYFIYRFLMTVKNYLFSNYDEINITLKENNPILLDKAISMISYLYTFKISRVYTNLIEQYFSIILVGIIIVSNIRSFLNTILFIYSKMLSNKLMNEKLQILLLSYFVALLYVNASLFIIFTLPLSYRKVLVKMYGDFDFSLLRYYSDKVFIYSSAFSVLFEIVYLYIMKITSF